MVVQPVYRLTTEDGKSIRTTGNHPYLTKDGWKTVDYLENGAEIAVADLPLGDPNSFFTNDDQLSHQTSALLESKESQGQADNLFPGHLANQDNYDPEAGGNIKAENVTESPIKSQKNSLAFNCRLENSLVRSTGESRLGDRQNIQAGLAQGVNQIQVNALVGQDFEHDLSRDGQDLFFAQEVGSVAKSFFGGAKSNRRILAGNFINSVAGLNQTQDIRDSNSGFSHRRLAKTNFRLDDNSLGGNQSFVHSDYEYTSTDKTRQAGAKLRGMGRSLHSVRDEFEPRPAGYIAAETKENPKPSSLAQPDLRARIFAR